MKRVCLLSLCTISLLTVVSFLPMQSPLADGGANHQVRNMHFGVSGGNVNDISRRFCCSGTLGSLVQDTSGTQFILSANHLLGLSGSATVGDDISQPGLVDNNCQVATVVADFTVAPALSSNVDAAIAQLRTGLMDGTGFIEDIGTISSVVKAPTVGLSIAKSGRTTGFTTGSIASINTTVRVAYPKICGARGGKPQTFTNQVVINGTSFSAGGDSGSLIVTNDNCHQPVALLFAGSSSDTIGNPIGEVLARLSASHGNTVSFVGGTCTAAATTAAILVKQLPQEMVDHATFIKERNEDRLLRKGSVIGVGVSAADDVTDEAVIVVYVDETTGITPNIAKTIEGLRVKVVYSDPFIAY